MLSMKPVHIRIWRMTPNLRRAIDGMLWAIATKTPDNAAQRARRVGRMAITLQRLREQRARKGHSDGREDFVE